MDALTALTALAAFFKYDLAGIRWGGWALLAFSIFATYFHGRQEVEGWWERRPEWARWVFLATQLLFVALAVVGFAFYAPLLWALAGFKLIDAIGFHAIFYPKWPGRETLLLPLADGILLTLYQLA